MSTVDFVVVVKNEVAYTRQCVESIFAHSPRPFHLILVDNGSTDETSEYFSELEQKADSKGRVTVIRNDQNRGYVVGVNQGLERTGAPYVILCNNDTVLYRGAIEELIRIADMKPEFGLVNPNSNEFGFGDYDEARLNVLKGTYRERCHTSGFFVLIKRGVINRVGGLDVAYNPGYFDDMDYSERAKRAGFLCLVANGAYVYHYGSRSFRPKQKEEYWRKNRALFTERWGGTRWFAYLGRQELKTNPEHRRGVVEQLVLAAREYSAMIYLFVPPGTRKYFESVHDGFRIVEISRPIQMLWFVAKAWRSFRKKPISRVYVSDPDTLRLAARLKPIHRAEPFYLSASQITG